MRASHCSGFSCGACALDVRALGVQNGAQSLWHAGSRAQASWLWHTRLVSQRRVESSWTEGQTHVPCTGRPISIYSATRELPIPCLKAPGWLPIAQNSCMITINTQLHHSVPCGFSTPIRLAFIQSLYSLSLTTRPLLIWKLQPVHFSSSVISSETLSLPLLHLL